MALNHTIVNSLTDVLITISYDIIDYRLSKGKKVN